MWKRRKNERGVLLGASIVVAIAIVLVIIPLYRGLRTKAVVNVYLNEIMRVRQLAESGMTQAFKELVYNPDVESVGERFKDLGKGEEILNKAHYRIDPNTGADFYWIETTASREVKGEKFEIKLHTYARIVNVAEYFLAVAEKDPPLSISFGADVAQAKIYAPNLIFEPRTDPGLPPTRVSRAQYYLSVDPPLVGDDWSSDIKSDFQILEDPQGRGIPEKLPAPLTLPEIQETDMNRYLSLAEPHHTGKKRLHR